MQDELGKEYLIYNPTIRKALVGNDENLIGGMLFYIRRWDEQLTKEQVDTENSKKDIY